MIRQEKGQRDRRVNRQCEEGNEGIGNKLGEQWEKKEENGMDDQ